MIQADIIVAEISTFQCEKCLAMLQKQWTTSSVRPSNSGCTGIVRRALKYLEMFSAATRASLTLLLCYPNYPRTSQLDVCVLDIVHSLSVLGQDTNLTVPLPTQVYKSGLKKYLNSSLAFQQAALTLFLHWASPRLLFLKLLGK